MAGSSRFALALAPLVALVCITSSLTAAPRPLKTAPLEIVTDKGDFRFQVEVADTPTSRERGLMFRKSLAGNRGMLFDFKQSQVVAFWMKNTLIPLDMLFIGADGRIVSIARDARPMDESAIPSGAPVLAVLELRGGRAAEIDALPGDKVNEAIFPR
jgi:uncharacterized membrane protein (UPF0127 family)